MLEWLKRNRRWIHGATMAVAVVWALLAALSGNPYGAIVAAMLALSQALGLRDARANPQREPREITGPQRALAYAMVAAGVGVMLMTIVIFVTA